MTAAGPRRAAEGVVNCSSALRGKPIVVVHTLTDSACVIAASYAAKAFGIKTGTLVREARRLCPEVAIEPT